MYGANYAGVNPLHRFCWSLVVSSGLETLSALLVAVVVDAPVIGLAVPPGLEQPVRARAATPPRMVTVSVVFDRTCQALIVLSCSVCWYWATTALTLLISAVSSSCLLWFHFVC